MAHENVWNHLVYLTSAYGPFFMHFSFAFLMILWVCVYVFSWLSNNYHSILICIIAQSRNTNQQLEIICVVSKWKRIHSNNGDEPRRNAKCRLHWKSIHSCRCRFTASKYCNLKERSRWFMVHCIAIIKFYHSISKSLILQLNSTEWFEINGQEILQIISSNAQRDSIFWANVNHSFDNISIQ